MRAVDFDEIEIGNKIIMDIPSVGFMRFEVESIDNEERSVFCKNNVMDFYPNGEDQYIVED
jgi:hypothetical protein